MPVTTDGAAEVLDQRGHRLGADSRCGLWSGRLRSRLFLLGDVGGFSAPGLVVLTAKVMVLIACMVKNDFA